MMRRALIVIIITIAATLVIIGPLLAVIWLANQR